QQVIPVQMRSQDRTVGQLDTYVYLVRLVSGALSTYSHGIPGDCAHRADTVIPADRRAAMKKQADLISDNIEVIPVVVLSQTFPARPSSIPDVRDFVKRCLAQSPLSEQDNREVGVTVAHALLEAAGPDGAINVSFRIFPDHVEVDVLRSGAQVGTPAGLDALASLLKSQAASMGAAATGRDGSGVRPNGNGSDEAAFADWMAAALRREGMTME